MNSKGLYEYLRFAQYSGWNRGGVTFGSVDVGWTEAEDNIYCELTKNGFLYCWSYIAKNDLVYAITFPK